MARNRVTMMAGLLMLLLTPTLAQAARCFVNLYGQWYEWQGACSDWAAYFNAGYGGDHGGCMYLSSITPAGGSADRPTLNVVSIVKYSATDVRLVSASGQEIPLASDSMQRQFDRIAPQMLKRPSRIEIPNDKGVISSDRLTQLSKATGARLSDAPLSSNQISLNPTNCYAPPCPWETNQWPWVGTLSNALAGAQVALLDSRGNVLSQTQVNRDGSYSLPAPRVAVKEAPRVCILRQGSPPLCGKPGDNNPTLTSPGISIRVLPVRPPAR